MEAQAEMFTRDDEFLCAFAAEGFFGDKVEALQGVFDDFFVPFFVETEFVDQEFLEDAVEECASADAAAASLDEYRGQYCCSLACNCGA